MATGFSHNKPINQPTNHLPQPPRLRPPDCNRSIEEIEKELGQEDGMADKSGVVVILRVLYIQ